MEDSSQSINHNYQSECVKSIRSTKGYILDNIKANNIFEELGINEIKNTYPNPSIDTKQARSDTTDLDDTSKSVQNDHTKYIDDNSLKRFQQEYNDLMKQRSEMKNSELETPPIICYTSIPRLIETNNNKSYQSSNKLSTTIDKNQTHNLQMNNSNKTESHDVDKNLIKNTNVDTTKHFDQNCSENAAKKNINNSSKKEQSCEYKKEINERCNHAKNIQEQQNKNTNINIQNKSPEGDDAKFYEMLDELNKEIMKIIDLFMNNNKTDSSNKCKCDSEMKRHDGNMFAAGAEYTDIEKSNLNQQNTFVVKKFTEEYVTYDLNEFDQQYVNDDELDDIEMSPNNSEEYYINNEFYPTQQTNDGFYQIQSVPVDFKNKNVESIQHFFSWQNPQVCQCGMICTNK